jgi:hypothetical protein|tara:strand:+ start:185 stop:334 length:150 start_codon:yes stop_codon:yes gene_type:complete
MFESQFSQKTDFKVKKTWRDYEEDSRKASFKIEYKNPRTGQNYDYEYEF